MPRRQRVDSSAERDPPLSDATEDDVVTESLRAIKLAMQGLKKENKQLKKDKEALETDIQVLRASANASSSARTKATSSSRIKSLEKELKTAKNDASKYKSRYEKLRTAELKKEQRELEGGLGDGLGSLEDTYLQMKKLLRSFRSSIEEIVLEDPGESGNYPDCAICYEELSKDTAAAFPCEHIFHMTCIRELDRHAKEQEQRVNRNLACPTCRQNWDLSEVLYVTRTASEQWQELIEIATEWAQMDTRRDDVDWTSDKTSEPSFIENDMESDDSEEEQVATGSHEDNREDASFDGEAQGERSREGEPTAPRTPPRSQKRRRLEELAAARSAKKQKR